jgi:GNAT superfamily N-acetyltransferase
MGRMTQGKYGTILFNGTRSGEYKMIEIINATSQEHLDQVRSLIREFVAWHRERHSADLELIDAYFDAGAFEKELAELPGKYSKPKGGLLLALYDGQPAGCVALREMDAQTCEMKRMFVYTQFHGKGVGRALANALIQEARTIGYVSMLLDTSVRQVEAQSLYQSLGFNKIEPYYELPERLKKWLVFMELRL